MVASPTLPALDKNVPYLLNFVSFRFQVQIAARSVCDAARNIGCGGMKLRDADDPREEEFAS